MIRWTTIVGAIVLIAIALLPSVSHAVSFGGDGTLGDFLGELTYAASTSSNATLTISLTNTSPVDEGGYLTAFVFNNPGTLITGITLAGSDPDFSLLGEGSGFSNGVKASPFGKFDIGASTGSRFSRGGSPSKGIGVGETATFTFSLTGSSFTTLTAGSFFGTLSAGEGGLCCEAFVSRFRGFEDGGSDKTPGSLSMGPVPEPSSLSLIGAGALTWAGFRAVTRRRRGSQNR